MAKIAENVTIKDARIIFKNLSGRPDKFTREGARSFHVVLTREEADTLRAQGWNVKERPPREEGDEPTYHLKVNVQFATRGRPPRVVMVGSKNKTRLDEGSVDILDYTDIEFVDIEFRPYEYDPGKYSAYLVKMFANIIEDELESRYSDLPEQGATSAREESFEEFDN